MLLWKTARGCPWAAGLAEGLLGSGIVLIASFCRFADELAASLEESATISWGSQNSQKGVFTQWQALEYIGGKIKPTKFARRTQYNKADEAREKLATVVVSHVPVIRYVLSQ